MAGLPAPDGLARWFRPCLRLCLPGFFAGLAVLICFALPIFGLRLGFSDEGNYPKETTTKKAYDLLAEGFGPGFNGPLVLAAELSPGTPQSVLDKVADNTSMLCSFGTDYTAHSFTRAAIGVTFYYTEYHPFHSAQAQFTKKADDLVEVLQHVIASTSPSFCLSLASTIAWICTSSLKPAGNSGRIGRSIKREVSVSLVVGRPSRLRKPPGNLPAAAYRSR